MLEIGDIVTWKVGNSTCRGIVRTPNINTTEVNTLEINNKRSRVTIDVITLILTKEN